MALTADELMNVFNTTLEFYERGKAKSQIKQVRPLYDDLMAAKRTFPGGDEYISGPVKGQYSTSWTGIGGDEDDELGYVNPTNVKRYRAKWYDHFAGLKFTRNELLRNGITVTDSTTGRSVSDIPRSDVVRLTNLFEDKMDDYTEGPARSMAEILWRDGSQDPLVMPGVLSFILDSPATGTTFSLDRAANSWWRNRASLAIDSATPGNQNLVNELQVECRQLRRYGSPRHKMYAGSDFIEAYEKELRAKGNYTLEGWMQGRAVDAGFADVMFKGMMIQYEPLLDDLSRAKYCYILDLNSIKLRPMAGEDMVDHYPARSETRFVFYRGKTFVGAVVADQLNTSGVYSIA